MEVDRFTFRVISGYALLVWVGEADAGDGCRQSSQDFGLGLARGHHGQVQRYLSQSRRLVDVHEHSRTVVLGARFQLFFDLANSGAQ